MRHRIRRKTAIAHISIALACLVLGHPHPANGADYSVLYNFNTQPGDGGAPEGALLQSGSKLYGVATVVGTNGGGTLFQYDLNTGLETTLYAFPTEVGDGKKPVDSLTQSGSILYGSTFQGGAHSQGTVFSYDLASGTESVLYSFAGGLSDGAFPTGVPLLSNNALYGMTGIGGTNSWGAIYKYDPSSGVESVVHSFTPSQNDAGAPVGSLIQVGANFYGMSSAGGTQGTIFQVDPVTGQIKILHGFTGGVTDGSLPTGSLVASGSMLYGMTPSGGDDNSGALFQYDLTDGQYTILHSFEFGKGDGQSPYGSVVLSGSALYGMTSNGGADGYGTVFEYDLTTRAESILHSFDGLDGTYPRGSLIASGNTLYGMAEGGGDTDLSAGVIFSVMVPEPASAMIGLGAFLLVARRRIARSSREKL